MYVILKAKYELKDYIRKEKIIQEIMEDNFF